MAAFLQVQVIGHAIPDRMVYAHEGIEPRWAQSMAEDAVETAKLLIPKMTGGAARRLLPIYGQDYFGIRWADDYVWYQESGTKPFTMWALKGKVIPMWIDDPTGQEARDNPKAKTRRTASGKNQVLIFRRATKPGAPGRINRREAGAPHTRAGRRGGAIQPGNIGVKWRNPGMHQRGFMNRAISDAVISGGLPPAPLIAISGGYVAKKSLTQALNTRPSLSNRAGSFAGNPSADELTARRKGR